MAQQYICKTCGEVSMKNHHSCLNRVTNPRGLEYTRMTDAIKIAFYIVLCGVLSTLWLMNLVMMGVRK
jgi:hypothetical protein